jgi:hypothetical protein
LEAGAHAVQLGLRPRCRRTTSQSTARSSPQTQHSTTPSHNALPVIRPTMSTIGPSVPARAQIAKNAQCAQGGCRSHGFTQAQKYPDARLSSCCVVADRVLWTETAAPTRRRLRAAALRERPAFVKGALSDTRTTRPLDRVGKEQRSVSSFERSLLAQGARQRQTDRASPIH